MARYGKRFIAGRDFRALLAARFRKRARYWRERGEGSDWPELANLGAEAEEMADRIEAGETVTVQGSDIGTLVYRRAVDVPSFVTVFPDGSIEPVREREDG